MACHESGCSNDTANGKQCQGNGNKDFVGLVQYRYIYLRPDQTYFPSLLTGTKKCCNFAGDWEKSRHYILNKEALCLLLVCEKRRKLYSHEQEMA